MNSMNRLINAIGRCGALWRTAKLEGTGIGAFDLPYLFYVCRHPGIPQESLCRALYVDKSSVTRHLSALEREGYIARAQSEKDRRVLLVSPTDRAVSMLPRLREISVEWNNLMTAGFSNEEKEAFAALLQRAFQNASRETEAARA